MDSKKEGSKEGNHHRFTLQPLDPDEAIRFISRFRLARDLFLAIRPAALPAAGLQLQNIPENLRAIHATFGFRNRKEQHSRVLNRLPPVLELAHSDEAKTYAACAGVRMADREFTSNSRRGAYGVR